MDNQNYETYTQHLKNVVDSRNTAEDSLKRAIASINYVTLDEAQYHTAREHIERSKELIISGNILLRSVTGEEHIGDMHNETLDEAGLLFENALLEVKKVIEIIERV